MAEFVTDRAREHVDRLKRLRAKGWHNMSAGERAEYTGYAAKGAYNYTDLNRVETAVSELAAELGLTLVTKTNWGVWDLPTVSDMSRYLSNVVAIRDACPGNVAFPDLPSSMSRLSLDGANNIEKVLLLVYEELHSSVEPDEPDVPDAPADADYIRSGEIYCGEVK